MSEPKGRAPKDDFMSRFAKAAEVHSPIAPEQLPTLVEPKMFVPENFKQDEKPEAVKAVQAVDRYGKEYQGPAGSTHSLKQLARKYTTDALTVVYEILMDRDENGSTRLQAADMIWNRGFGKPAQEVKSTQVKVTLKDVEAKYIENLREIKHEMIEAEAVESGRFGKLIEQRQHADDNDKVAGSPAPYGED